MVQLTRSRDVGYCCMIGVRHWHRVVDVCI